MSMHPYWKGHDYPKDKGGKLLNLEPMGKKPCVNHPFVTADVGWGHLLLGSGGWQDCQSLPTCPLHQQTFYLHVGRKMGGIHSILAHPHTLTGICYHFVSRKETTAKLHCLAHSHAQDVSWFWLTQWAGSHVLSSTISLWRAIHVFQLCACFPYRMWLVYILSST